jgi:hypothetical protein
MSNDIPDTLPVYLKYKMTADSDSVDHDSDLGDDSLDAVFHASLTINGLGGVHSAELAVIHNEKRAVIAVWCGVSHRWDLLNPHTGEVEFSMLPATVISEELEVEFNEKGTVH